MSVRIGDETVKVIYANNFWTDGRTASFVLGVTLVALMAIAGTYAVYPLQDLGFSSFGWGLIGGAGVLAGLEVALVLMWVRQSKPTFQLHNSRFADLHRFQEEKAFDFYRFEENNLSFVSFFIKTGEDKRFVVSCDNHLSESFLNQIKQTHRWIPPSIL
jgi:hypothetical protein